MSVLSACSYNTCILEVLVIYSYLRFRSHLDLFIFHSFLDNLIVTVYVFICLWSVIKSWSEEEASTFYPENQKYQISIILYGCKKAS